MNLRESFEYCRQSTRRHAKSFYFASHALPGMKRRAAYAVYSFCRLVDDMIDDAPSQERFAHNEITHLRRYLDRIYETVTNDHPIDAAVRATVQRYSIPKQYFEDLITGVEMDLRKNRFEHFSELYEYCYHVASVVGMIMTKIFGARGETALSCACDLGTAMQLTNILRDVREDYEMGRIYLPQQEMRRFGYTEEDLSRGLMNDRFKALMQFQIVRARNYYQRAANGIPLLTDDGSRLCVQLMSATYGEILREIEKLDYNVFAGRATVSTSRKLRLATGVIVAAFRKNSKDREQEDYQPSEKRLPENALS